MVLPYFNWKTNIPSVRKKINQTRNHYVDISDEGGARFSKRAAEDFLRLLVRTFTSQDFSVPPLSDAYAEWKRKNNHFSEIGFMTGEMVGALTTFRTRAGGDVYRRGWAVGIPSTNADNAFLAQKLFWLEEGTGPKGGRWKAGPQPPRSIVAQALEEFLQTDLPPIIKQSADISRYWRK